jgi:hypothetical protein
MVGARSPQLFLSKWRLSDQRNGAGKSSSVCGVDEPAVQGNAGEAGILMNNLGKTITEKDVVDPPLNGHFAWQLARLQMDVSPNNSYLVGDGRRNFLGHTSV